MPEILAERTRDDLFQVLDSANTRRFEEAQASMRKRDCELDCRHIADGKEIPACTHSPLEETTEECLCLRYCTDPRGEYERDYSRREASDKHQPPNHRKPSIARYRHVRDCHGPEHARPVRAESERRKLECS